MPLFPQRNAARPPMSSEMARASSLPATVEASGGLSAAITLNGLEIRDTRPVPFWAVITGQASSTNRYAWTQVDDGDSPTFDANLSESFAASGTSAEDGGPAYEINGRTDVPTDSTVRVRMYPAGDGSFYVFRYVPIVNGSITGSGTDEHVTRWDGTSAVQDSLWQINDSGLLQLNQNATAFPLIASDAGFQLKAGSSVVTGDALDGLGFRAHLYRTTGNVTDCQASEFIWHLGTTAAYKTNTLTVLETGYFFTSDVGTTLDHNHGFSVASTPGGTATTGGLTFQGGLYISGTATGGTGTVTSVDGSGGSTGLTLTGGAITTSGTLTLGGTLNLASGGTGASLSDPGADKLLAWDDTDNSVGFWTLGTGLTYTHATHTLSVPGYALNNLTATAPPAVTDDSGDGYTGGSLWWDTVAKIVYVLRDKTVGAAVWEQIAPAVPDGISELTGDVTAGPGAGSVAATIANAAVTYAKFQNVAGLSVVGRSANSSGVSAAITAGTDGHVLRLSGTTLGFGTVVTAGIADTAVTYAKIQDVTTSRLLGRKTAGSGVVEEISFSNGIFLNGGVLSVQGSTLPPFIAAGGSHATGGVPDPGATAHTNFPYFLGDDAAWHKRLHCIDASFVATSQTTTAGTGSPGELATTQQISFTLDETSDVLIMAVASGSNSAIGSVFLFIDVDGSNTQMGRARCDTATAIYTIAGGYIATSLSSGSHTLKLKFATSTGTATFENRTISVWRKA